MSTKTTAMGEAVVEQIEEASFYGKGFHGKTTASGKTFNHCSSRPFLAAYPLEKGQCFSCPFLRPEDGRSMN